MKTTIRTHPMYTEWKKTKLCRKYQMVDKKQYIFSSPKGKISCVKFLNYWGFIYEGEHFWEIYCLSDKKDKNKKRLFEDCQRFDTLEKAKEKCKGYLDDDGDDCSESKQSCFQPKYLNTIS